MIIPGVARHVNARNECVRGHESQIKKGRKAHYYTKRTLADIYYQVIPSGAIIKPDEIFKWLLRGLVRDRHDTQCLPRVRAAPSRTTQVVVCTQVPESNTPNY